MSRRLIALIASLVAVVAALVLLFLPVGATSPGGRALDCGSGFASSNLAANPASGSQLAAEIERARLDTRYSSLMAGYTAACGDALVPRRWVGFGLLGVGVLGLVGVLVMGRPRRQVSAPRSPVTP